MEPRSSRERELPESRPLQPALDFPGTPGERRIFDRLNALGVPFDFKPNPTPRPELSGIPASFVMSNRIIINVSDELYTPMQQAIIRGSGYYPIELSEYEAIDWKETDVV